MCTKQMAHLPHGYEEKINQQDLLIDKNRLRMLAKLSAELREAREKKGITPEALAKIIKMDLRYLKRMEAGDYTFFPDVYLKAFIRSYAKTIGLNEELYVQKFIYAREGRSMDEAEAASPVYERHPDAEPQPLTEEEKRLKEVAPLFSQPKSKPVVIVKRYEEPEEPEPKKRVKLNAMQKRMIIFATLSLIVIVMVGYGVYRSNLNQTIIYEGPAATTPEDLGQARYEEKPKETPTRFDDSLVLRMEFSDLCWVRVIPDSLGESSENTFNKNSDPAEFKATKKFIVNIGNPPAVRLLLDNKDVAFKKDGNNPIKLLVTKDSTVTLYLGKPADKDADTTKDKKKSRAKVKAGR